MILVTGVIGGVLLSGNNQSTEPLSQEVMDYAPVIHFIWSFSVYYSKVNVVIYWKIRSS